MSRLLTPPISPDVEARFWAKVNKASGQGPHGDCWCWTKALVEGYPGYFRVGAHKYRASHVALAIIGKPRPSTELGALHSCDNRACVRPEHLRWGTFTDNLEDAIARWNRKGRSFSPDEVREIRGSSMRHCDIARHFGVSQPCIWQIINRVTHKHVA